MPRTAHLADDDEVPVRGGTIAEAVNEPVLLLAPESSLGLTQACLERLSKGQLTVSIRTTRETAKGAAQNQVTVYVETPEAGLLPYESLSGGQKFRVDVAFRIGLSEVISRGTGTPIETFLLDEGWGTLDESGITNMVETLFRLSEEVNLITVSHIGAVQDAFSSRVEVSMNGAVSSAQVIRSWPTTRRTYPIWTDGVRPSRGYTRFGSRRRPLVERCTERVDALRCRRVAPNRA